MARPTKPKDIKPKAEGEIATLPTAMGGDVAATGGLDLKFIITLVVVVLSTALTSAASVYFLAPMVVTPPIEAKLAKLAAPEGGEHAEAGAAAHEDKVGLNLQLDEFTVNLKEDPESGGSQYLRAKMSLNIAVPDTENCYAVQHASVMPSAINGGKIVGAAANIDAKSPGKSPVDQSQLANGGGGEDPTVACINKFKGNMSKFVPTMRDVINAALMKRTAGTLSTLEGQESLKDEIKESVNQFMGEHYQIARVNFEDFIIQK